MQQADRLPIDPQLETIYSTIQPPCNENGAHNSGTASANGRSASETPPMNSSEDEVTLQQQRQQRQGRSGVPKPPEEGLSQPQQTHSSTPTPPGQSRKRSPSSTAMLPAVEKRKAGGPWTRTEDLKLTQMKTNGNDWDSIFQAFPNRTPVSIRKHWSLAAPANPQLDPSSAGSESKTFPVLYCDAASREETKSRWP
ncbi:myb dna-binding domain, partial [Fusarium albosuccineum]